MASHNNTRTFISSPQLQKPQAPYSQAVLVNQTLYISGQLGLDHKTGQLVSGGAGPQTKQALEAIGALLKAAGADYTHVVKTTVLYADINDREVVNNQYKQYFKNNFPARTSFQAANLPQGAQVEIEAIAVIGNITNTNNSQ